MTFLNILQNQNNNQVISNKKIYITGFNCLLSVEGQAGINCYYNNFPNYHATLNPNGKTALGIGCYNWEETSSKPYGPIYFAYDSNINVAAGYPDGQRVNVSEYWKLFKRSQNDAFSYNPSDLGRHLIYSRLLSVNCGANGDFSTYNTLPGIGISPDNSIYHYHEIKYTTGATPSAINAQVIGYPKTTTNGGTMNINSFNLPVLTNGKFYIPFIKLTGGFEYFIEMVCVSKFVKVSNDTKIENFSNQSEKITKNINNDSYNPTCQLSFTIKNNHVDYFIPVLELDGSNRNDVPTTPVYTSTNMKAFQRIAAGNVCRITIISVPIE